jgi:hypothetical protein
MNPIAHNGAPGPVTTTAGRLSRFMGEEGRVAPRSG